MEEWVFRARWLVASGSAPLADAGIVVSGDRIVAIERFARLAGRRRAIDLGDCVVLPPLVNAHTHWEFSALQKPVAVGESPTDWLEAVVRSRRQSSVPRAEALLRGLHETTAAGTFAVGEIATCDPDVYRAAAQRFAPESGQGAHLQCFLFRELIGLRDDSVAKALRTAECHVADAPATAVVRDGAVAAERGARAPIDSSSRPGQPERSGVVWHRALSPHAPYSVREDLLAASVALARKADVPVAIHFAEFPQERELLARGTGPLRSFLERLGVCDGTSFPAGRTHRDLLEILSAAPRVLLIHGNDLTDSELTFLRQRPQFSLVYCPRTHAHFGHPPHPFERARALGINVALGTDSRASNPDLSILQELRFLQRRTGRALTDLLPLASENPLRALGLTPARALCPGAPAVATIITARYTPAGRDFDRWILESSGLRGNVVRSAGDWRAVAAAAPGR